MDKKFNFQELQAIIATLRGENGCPWDKSQTHESLKLYTLEEAYEVNQAVTDLTKTGDCANLKEELGDLLFQVLLQSQVAEDNGEFAIEDVIDGVARKMIHRHPHVFAGRHYDSVEIPVVCAGRMQPDEASASISEGKLDAMGIGRQFLVDPEYIVKLEQEKFSDILPCIACHNACLPIYHYEGVGCEIDEEDGKTQGHCALNPRTFCEQKYDFGKKAAVTKSIAVIGGGIAGMTVARIAAIRGHEVTIYEKSDRLCGVFNAAAAPEFKEKDKEFIRWIQQEIESLPIKVEYNCEITTLAELTADEIIIATGAKPKKLDVPGQEKAIEATEYLLGGKVGKDVAVIGGGLTGCEIAYDLVLKGKRPVIVEMADDILKTKGLCMANSSCLRDLLRYYEVPIYKNAKLLEIIENGIVIETAEKTIQLECDDVIMSCGYMPDTRLVDGGTQQGKTNIHIVGDVKKVGNLKTAIWEAYDLAFSL